MLFIKINWVTFSTCSLGIPVPTITNHTHIWLTTPTIIDHTHILAKTMVWLSGIIFPAWVWLLVCFPSYRFIITIGTTILGLKSHFSSFLFFLVYNYPKAQKDICITLVKYQVGQRGQRVSLNATLYTIAFRTTYSLFLYSILLL